MSAQGPDGTAIDSGPPDPPGGLPVRGNRPPRQKVGKACENCRRRRVKCDGLKPFCGTCIAYNDECQWTDRTDYRKPLSRQQVDALRSRIADLEGLLRTHGIDPVQDPGNMLASARSQARGSLERVDSGGPTPTRLGVSVGMDGADVLQAPDVQVEHGDWPNSHLVENETGEFQVFGPTSSLRHLVAFRQSSIERSRPDDAESSRCAPGISRASVDDPTSSSSSRLINEVETRPKNGAGEIDFRRYLPRDIELTREEHDDALDQFFRYHASWGQQTHPVHFRTDMQLALSVANTITSSRPTRTAHYSPMLHNAILSIGLRFSSSPHLSSLETLLRFSDEAKKHMRVEGMNPSVATVQALAHLASHHNLMAEHNLGWLQIGMAVRCGLTLGLNVDPALLVQNGRLTEAQARDRNVTYWMTFVQEGLWAPYIGRPVNWPAHTTPPPVIDAKLDQLPWIAPLGKLAVDSQPGMISSAFVETVKLMAIGDKILNTLYGITADLVALSRSGAISDISLSLSTWLEGLPPALKLNSHSIRTAMPHILTMHISWASFMIMLHKPFYRPLVSLPTNGTGEQPASNHNAMLAVKQCDRAAAQIVSLCQTWHKLHDLRFAPPPILECCFTAGTTHLLAYTCARTRRKQVDALARAKECTRLMEIMATSWPAAQQKKELLDQLTAQYTVQVATNTLNGLDHTNEDDREITPQTDPPVVDLAESFGMVRPYDNGVSLPETDNVSFGQHRQEPLLPAHQPGMAPFPSYTLPTGYAPPTQAGSSGTNGFHVGPEPNQAFAQAPPGLARWDISALAPPHAPIVAAPSNSSTAWQQPISNFDHMYAFDGTDWDIDTLAMLDPALWLDDGSFQSTSALRPHDAWVSLEVSQQTRREPQLPPSANDQYR